MKLFMNNVNRRKKYDKIAVFPVHCVFSLFVKLLQRGDRHEEIRHLSAEIKERH